MKTIIGLFDNYADAERAANDLKNHGVAAEDVSLLASNDTERYGKNPAEHVPGTTTSAAVHDAEVGAGIGGVLGLLAGASLFVIPGLGWLAGAGWLTGLIGGAVVGGVTGGLVGALLHLGVPQEDAAYYEEGIRRGGTLVAVRAREDQADRVASLLSDEGAVNIDERASAWQAEGFRPVVTDGSTTMTAPQIRPAGVSRSVYTPMNAEPTPFGARPEIRTGGQDADGSPDTRGIMEKTADTLTGDNLDDKTGKPVR